MSKSENLRKLYDKIEVDSTEERELLSKVKNGNASNEEVDELLDLLKEYPKGVQKLKAIKSFEENLVSDMNQILDYLEDMESEYIDVAHIEDELEKDKRYSNMKKRYKKLTKQAEETLEAIKIAYFQISDYSEFEDRLYNVKDTLAYFE